MELLDNDGGFFHQSVTVRKATLLHQIPSCLFMEEKNGKG